MAFWKMYWTYATAVFFSSIILSVCILVIGTAIQVILRNVQKDQQEIKYLKVYRGKEEE